MILKGCHKSFQKENTEKKRLAALERLTEKNIQTIVTDAIKAAPTEGTSQIIMNSHVSEELKWGEKIITVYLQDPENPAKLEGEYEVTELTLHLYFNQNEEDEEIEEFMNPVAESEEEEANEEEEEVTSQSVSELNDDTQVESISGTVLA